MTSVFPFGEEPVCRLLVVGPSLSKRVPWKIEHVVRVRWSCQQTDWRHRYGAATSAGTLMKEPTTC